MVLLTGSQGSKQRRAALAEAASGAAGIVVGTHALLSETVQFADLGLVVVDEQHRFGVEQRDALRARGERPPHMLVMTATPIPRTVAMTVFGDLETSVLTERPAGRAETVTHVVPADNPVWMDAHVGSRPRGGRRGGPRLRGVRAHRPDANRPTPWTTRNAASPNRTHRRRAKGAPRRRHRRGGDARWAQQNSRE